MKKLFIILAFLPLLLSGQIPQTGLERWISGYEISGDTLLVDSLTGVGNTNWVITNCADQLTNITNGYIDIRSECKINGQNVNTYFANTDRADTAFYEMLDKTINSDSIILLPPRLNSIAKYASAQIGANLTYLLDYFNVPSIYLTGANVPNDHLTINAAVLAGIDTIEINTGIYVENSGSGYLNLPNTVVLQGIGNVILNPSGASLVVVRATNTQIKNITLNGNGTAANGIVRGSTLATFNNYESLHFKGISSKHISSISTGTEFNKCSFVGDLDYVLEIVGDQYSFVMNECYSNARTVNGIIDKFIQNDTSISDITYNRFIINESEDIFTGSTDLNFKYNDVITYDSLNARMLSILSNTTRKQLNVKGNSFIHNKIGNSFSIFTDPPGLFDINLDNNYVKTSGGGSEYVNVVELHDFNGSVLIQNNFLDILNGNSIFIDSILTGNSLNILNNRIYSRTAENNDQWLTVRLQIFPDDIEPKINGNVILNAISFGESFGGHAALFLNGIINAEIKNDSVFGAGISSIVYKHDGGNNTSALIQSNVSDKILIKGQRKVKIYNNTVKGVSGGSYGIGIIENQDVGTTDKRADSNMVYNNLVTTMDTALMINNSFGLAANTFSNNNIFHAGVEVNYNGTDRSLEWWQTNFLQDLNSYNTNPNLKSSTELWPIYPSDAIGNGKYLIGYDTILNISSVFPNGIIKKAQFARKTMGAYVSPLDTIDYYGADTTTGIWATKFNSAKWLYMDNSDTIILGTDNFTTWSIKENEFIYPQINDSIIYGTDNFETWRIKFNNAVDSANAE